MSAVAARAASTVVMVRPSLKAPCEVLLVRRNDTAAFMAGAFVFPGGRVDEGDYLERPAGNSTGLESVRRFIDLTAEEELAYRVAAIRELEEEAAILLARRDGHFVDRHVARDVRKLMNDSPGLFEALAKASLDVAVDALLPIAHWVTPELEARRYDTRFFLASMPEDQDAQHDAGETTEFMWVTPADAMARCRNAEIMLPPPTWTTLARLAPLANFGEVLAWARSISLVRVQPNLIREGDVTMLTLPGDPLHPPMAGWDPPEETRFVLQEGKGWRATRA
ncbi:MAG: hypothetical protein ABR606_18055 [Vicinamibacterales bacterium]